jgi:hypothetical protein
MALDPQASTLLRTTTLRGLVAALEAGHCIIAGTVSFLQTKTS